MASTSTNKQPLLVDRVFHIAVDMNPHKVTSNATTPGSVTGANTAAKILDQIAGDGAVIESMYTISRATAEVALINLYLSPSGDYLRPDQSVFIGQIKSTDNVTPEIFEKRYVPDLPPVLAPVAHTGDDPQMRALYIPKGMALWAGIQLDAGTDINVQLVGAPILGVQGGYY